MTDVNTWSTYCTKEPREVHFKHELDFARLHDRRFVFLETKNRNFVKEQFTSFNQQFSHTILKANVREIKHFQDFPSLAHSTGAELITSTDYVLGNEDAMKHNDKQAQPRSSLGHSCWIR